MGGVNNSYLQMAEDEILFDDIYTLGEIVGKYVNSTIV